MKVFDILRKIVRILIAILFFSVVAVTFAQVVARHVLNNSIIWAEEFSRYTFIWVVMLACSLAVGSNSHINIDIIYKVIPVKLHKIYKLTIDFLMLIFFVFMIRQSFLLIATAGSQVSAAMRIPMETVYIGLPVGFALMFLFGVERFILEFKSKNTAIEEKEG